MEILVYAFMLFSAFVIGEWLTKQFLYWQLIKEKPWLNENIEIYIVPIKCTLCNNVQNIYVSVNDLEKITTPKTCYSCLKVFPINNEFLELFNTDNMTIEEGREHILKLLYEGNYKNKL